MNKDEQKGYERASVAAALQDRFYALGFRRPTQDQAISRALFDLATEALLHGASRVPKRIADEVLRYADKRSDLQRLELVRDVWHKVGVVTGDFEIDGLRRAAKNLLSTNGPDAFEIVAGKMGLSVGTVTRIYYAELKRRRLAGGWVPEKRIRTKPPKRMVKRK